MGRNKRSSAQGTGRAEQWLGHGSSRARRWAYEELLLGSDGDARELEGLSSLAADLAVDLAELRRMQAELHEQVVKVAGLEGRIQALLRTTPEDRDREIVVKVEDHPTVEIRSFPSALDSPPASLERNRALTRCEGYRVESSEGLVGIVEGLRFQSRIDAPDLLEVRGGRFGRELMLIPTEAVDEISPEEELVVVRGVPGIESDHLHDLMGRVRRALSVHHVPPGGLSEAEDTLS